MRQASQHIPAPAGPTGGVLTAPQAGPLVSPLPTPTTPEEIVAIRARREELSSQLVSAQGRRSALSKQLQNPMISNADRAGLEGRLAVIDKRMAQLENDLAETGRQLTTAPGSLLATTAPSSNPGNFSSGQVTAISIVFTACVLMPIAIALARGIWRRTSRPKAVEPAPDFVNRFNRLEQGVEAIAIEVERVSEGQRFVTKLLGERAAQEKIGVK
jgi:hypothetical protein